MKRTILFCLLITLLAFPALALAQEPTAEPDVTVESPPVVVVEQPIESDFDIVKILGVFAAGAIAFGAGLKAWQATGGSLSGTISGVANSSEFATLIREAQEVIPANVHQQTLSALSQANDLNKAFGELLATLSENLKKP